MRLNPKYYPDERYYPVGGAMIQTPELFLIPHWVWDSFRRSSYQIQDFLDYDKIQDVITPEDFILTNMLNNYEFSHLVLGQNSGHECHSEWREYSGVWFDYDDTAFSKKLKSRLFDSSVSIHTPEKDRPYVFHMLDAHHLLAVLGAGHFVDPDITTKQQQFRREVLTHVHQFTGSYSTAAMSPVFEDYVLNLAV